MPVIRCRRHDCGVVEKGEIAWYVAGQTDNGVKWEIWGDGFEKVRLGAEVLCTPSHGRGDRGGRRE